jgi:hypothetical protein
MHITNPASFVHGVLERFTAGLNDAGRSNEVVRNLPKTPVS